MIRLLLEARDPETGAGLDPRGIAQRGGGHLHGGARDDRELARLELVSAVAGARRRSSAACRTGRGIGWSIADARRCAATRLYASGVRGDDPAVSAGAVPRAPGTAGRADPQPQDPRGLARRGRAVAAAPPSAALGQARPLHPSAVSARECRGTAALQLCSIQRRAAGLRRAGLRVDRGDPLPRDIGPASPVAPLARHRGRAGVPADIAARATRCR